MTSPANRKQSAATPLRRIPLPVLVGVVTLSIGASFVTGINLVAPELRYAFYIIAGLTSGMWLLALRNFGSLSARLAIAALTAVAAVEIVERSIEAPPSALPLAGAGLVLGLVGWFSFMRHVEDEAQRAGGWRTLLRLRGD